MKVVFAFFSDVPPLATIASATADNFAVRGRALRLRRSKRFRYRPPRYWALQ